VPPSNRPLPPGSLSSAHRSRFALRRTGWHLIRVCWGGHGLSASTPTFPICPRRSVDYPSTLATRICGCDFDPTQQDILYAFIENGLDTGPLLARGLDRIAELGMPGTDWTRVGVGLPVVSDPQACQPLRPQVLDLAFDRQTPGTLQLAFRVTGGAGVLVCRQRRSE
jgi:hypothetical protein